RRSPESSLRPAMPAATPTQQSRPSIPPWTEPAFCPARSPPQPKSTTQPTSQTRFPWTHFAWQPGSWLHPLKQTPARLNLILPGPYTGTLAPVETSLFPPDCLHWPSVGIQSIDLRRPFAQPPENLFAFRKLQTNASPRRFPRKATTRRF